MNITKCDLCKRTIKKGGAYFRLFDAFVSFELCSNCSEPIVELLKSKGLIKDKKEGKKKK